MGGIISAVILFGFLGSARQEAPPERLGRDICQACHDMQPVFLRTPHGEAECEDCHGPGSGHVESGGQMPMLMDRQPPSWGVDKCLSCHGTRVEFGGFNRSAHGRSELSCIDCHRIHPEAGGFRLLKTDEITLCSSCHQASRAEFQKPFHHPLREGGMTCVDCHSPHWEETRPQLVKTARQDEGCMSCHTDKLGPFVFEHAPLKVDNCQSCHQPHGSFNARLLTRSQVHQLCLECHSLTPGIAASQPPAFHDLRTARFRACTVCHHQIHGSNTHPAFLR